MTREEQPFPLPEEDQIGPSKAEDDILQLYASEEFRKLTEIYGKPSFFSRLGISRKEFVHTRVLAWLLNPMSDHGLGTDPVKKFLHAIAAADRRFRSNGRSLLNQPLSRTLITDSFQVSQVSLEIEKSIRVLSENNGKNGRIDLFLIVKLKRLEDGLERQIPIVLENKVMAKEFHDQTETYFQWATEALDSADGFENAVFVYLSPASDSELLSNWKKACKNENFIRMNYQILVDFVYQPSVARMEDGPNRHFLEEYIRCLNPLDGIVQSDESGNSGFGSFPGKELAMAVGKEERELMQRFWQNNKPFLLAVMEVLETDPETSESERKIMEKSRRLASQKDFSMYFVNGKGPFRKTSLAQEIVRVWVDNHTAATFEQLRKEFPKEVQGSFEVVCKSDDATIQKDCSRKTKRYRHDYVPMKDGTKVAVCSQWGADTPRNKGNIDNLLALARSKNIDVVKLG